MDRILMPGHLLRKRAALVDLGDAVLVGPHARGVKVIIVRDDADGNCGKTAPVVMVVAVWFVPRHHACSRGIKPGSDTGLSSTIELSVIDQHGVCNAKRAQGPLHLIPGL